MEFAKLSVTAAFFITLLFGCGDKGPANQVGKVTQERSPNQSEEIKRKPVRGIVRGQVFRIDQAILHNSTLTLRQGKEFFADRSIDIVMFGYDSLENAAIKVGTGTGLDSPHLRLGIMNKNEGLPDEITVMNGYEMELTFGKASDLGIPFSIRLATNDPPRTDVEGEFFATFKDIRLDGGKVDLTYDSFDTLRHVARQYLTSKYNDIELVEDFNASYKSSGDADYPITGFIGYEAATNGSPLIVKLQLYKDKKGWRVLNQLAENQISPAHPVEENTGENERSIQAGRARKQAALKLESYLNDQALMPRVRSTSVGCYTSKDLDKASCRAVYGLKEPGEVACMNKNYLLVRNEQNWHVEREIKDTERIDHSTGELVTYKPFSMNCS